MKSKPVELSTPLKIGYLLVIAFTKGGPVDLDLFPSIELGLHSQRCLEPGSLMIKATKTHTCKVDDGEDTDDDRTNKVCERNGMNCTARGGYCC